MSDFEWNHFLSIAKLETRHNKELELLSQEKDNNHYHECKQDRIGKIQ